MARRTFGINTKRQNITVPAVGEIGCARFEPEDCCDGGSGRVCDVLTALLNRTAQRD